MRRLSLGSGPRAWLRTELCALVVIASCGVAVQMAAARNLISDRVSTTLLGQIVWLSLGMALAVASVAADRGELNPRAVRAVSDHPGLCWLGAGAAFAALTSLLHPAGSSASSRRSPPANRWARRSPRSRSGSRSMRCIVAPAIFGESAAGCHVGCSRLAPLAWLGLVSYGMYLWHLAIVELLGLRVRPGTLLGRGASAWPSASRGSRHPCST